MTKSEFLEYLEKKLQVLNQKERDDILSEYAQHIELKMESGLSEEDAIHDFGDLEELAAEILDAYNVNPDYDKRIIQIDGRKIGKRMTKAGHKVGGLFHRCSQAAGNIFKDNSVGNFKLVIRCCLIFTALFAVYLPLAALDIWFGDVLYSICGRPFDYLLSGAVIIVFHLFYLFFSVSVLYTYISSHRHRRDAGQPEENGEEEIAVDREEDGAEEERRHVPAVKKAGRRLGGAAKWMKNLFTLPGFSGKEPASGGKGIKRFVKLVCNVIKACISLLVKGIIVCCLTPVLLMLLFLVIAFGTLIVLVALGYPLVGVTVISLGGLLSGFAFVWFVGSFLFSKKVGKEE
ncbi:hypothetical protein C0033_24425 [Clostridium sp. chh4-2]|uniref:DUF1700 domain-containing protein n=1 Tax=Clostridium sp. chh4-2 TaxID=2067550 RepID=UPI000CCEC72F|nr:DUF1700 domain-containing protein [Clostridium sp. chh4-2]PNV59387.1 hypothetical protein C0033_24425 [Clostridium sp. chh4-2]